MGPRGTDVAKPGEYRLSRGMLPGAVMLLVSMLVTPMAVGSDRESQVKAAFLLNFVKMVEWPGSAFEGHPGTINLCVPAGDPLAEMIPSLQGKSTRGKSIVWKGYDGFDTVTDCQIIFVPERRRLAQAIKATGSRPILLVGAQDGFCQAGGGINLVPTEGRLGFEINLKALQRVDLKAGAQLVKVAREVIP